MSATMISVEDLGKRFRRGPRWAAARMRDMRHVQVGADLFTTEEWLTEWITANSVPQKNWPVQNLDPLEEAVCSRVIQIMGELAAVGKIKVLKV